MLANGVTDSWCTFFVAKAINLPSWKGKCWFDCMWKWSWNSAFISWQHKRICHLIKQIIVYARDKSLVIYLWLWCIVLNISTCVFFSLLVTERSQSFLVFLWSSVLISGSHQENLCLIQNLWFRYDWTQMRAYIKILLSQLKTNIYIYIFLSHASNLSNKHSYETNLCSLNVGMIYKVNIKGVLKSLRLKLHL